MDNERIEQCVEFLCKEDSDREIFYRDFFDKNNPTSSLWHYRDFLEQTGQRGHVAAKELDEAIEHNNYEMLFELIQELFIESLPRCYLSYLHRAVEHGITGQDIVNWYNNKNRPHTIFVNPHIIKVIT